MRQIVAQGHELASHGYGHERASDLSEDAFFADIDRAKQLLQDVGGVAVQGYRAPSFSIGTGNLWAFDSLARAGYRYSSSIYPIHHDHYGMPDAPRFAHEARAGVLEIPVTTLRWVGRNFPSSGGGYFRLLPYALSRWMLRQVNRRDGQPAIFYFHPWEIDADQPRVAGIDAKTRFRHYVNIDRMAGRLEQLLRDFAWGRMDHIFLRSGVALIRWPRYCVSNRMMRRAQRAGMSSSFACPAATFFHRAGWQRVLRDSMRHDTHFLYCEVDGRIEGVLPLAHVRSLLFGKSLVSLPFAVYGGVAADHPAAADALEAAAQRLAQQLGVAHLELRNVQARHSDWPAQDLYVTFRKPILADEEANMLAIPRKQRAMVRKGIKNDLRGEIDTGVERFFPLYADNVHRHGTPALSRRYFEALLREFGADCRSPDCRRLRRPRLEQRAELLFS